MLGIGQTLRHKVTNDLVRLDPQPGDGPWAWDVGKKTALISRDGTKFIDDINNYTNIVDELGRPYAKQPKPGQFVDESAEKYLVSKAKMAKMRKKRLEEWEAELLYRMENGGPKPNSSDIAGRFINNPFADGGWSGLFEKFFLKRRNAKPLYRYYGSIKKKFVDGPFVFRYKGKQWIYRHIVGDLVVMKFGPLRRPHRLHSMKMITKSKRLVFNKEEMQAVCDDCLKYYGAPCPDKNDDEPCKDFVPRYFKDTGKYLYITNKWFKSKHI